MTTWQPAQLLHRMQHWQQHWPTPFVVPLHDDSGNRLLVIEAVLRHFPGRRLVVQGRFEDRPVLAKIAVHSVRQRTGADFAYEARISQTLSERGIQTPALVTLLGPTKDDLQVLMFEYLPEARTLLQLQQDASRRTAFLPAFRQAVTELSRLHGCGFVHQDPHLGNFLLADERLHVIDCADIKADTDASAQRDNLVLLLAQLPLLPASQLLELAHGYSDHDGALADHDLQSLPEAVERRWWLRTNKYLRKMQRNCSDVAVIQNTWQRVVYRRSLDRNGLGMRVADPESLFDGAEWLKRGNTASVVKVRIDGRVWVVKRYNIKNPWHWLRRCLRRSRAWFSWHNAHLLQRLDIATPAPVAYIEKRMGPLRRTAYFISEYVDAEELADAAARRPLNETEKQQIAALFSTLARTRLHHGDFKARNLLTDGKRVYLIDLDAMHRPHRMPARAARLHAKDVNRFLDNQCFDEHLRDELAQLLH